ncbi:hypothetical protein NL500_28420, partial [Klebsiella pneumoniae]|nr:hypothetical protein [Klebsiella pneumoniae]
EKFKKNTEQLVNQFKSTDKQLITSFTSNKKQSEQLHRLYLLHNNAEGIFAELLELKTKEVETLPDVLIEMMQYIERSVSSRLEEQEIMQWREKIELPVSFQRLEKQIYRTDEILH